MTQQGVLSANRLEPPYYNEEMCFVPWCSRELNEDLGVYIFAKRGTVFVNTETRRVMASIIIVCGGCAVEVELKHGHIWEAIHMEPPHKDRA